MLKAAIDVSLQKPVDPLKLVSSKVRTTTMALRLRTLTLRMAVVWPTPPSPPPGAKFVIAAIVQAQHPSPAIGIDICITARGMSCMPLLASLPSTQTVCVQVRVTRQSASTKAPEGRSKRKAVFTTRD